MIIEGQYTMTDTARKLEQDVCELQRALGQMDLELAEAERREWQANERADTYAQLTAVLIVVTALLCVALALAT